MDSVFDGEMVALEEVQSRVKTVRRLARVLLRGPRTMELLTWDDGDWIVRVFHTVESTDDPVVRRAIVYRRGAGQIVEWRAIFCSDDSWDVRTVERVTDVDDEGDRDEWPYHV